MPDWKNGLLWFFLLGVLPFGIYGIHAHIRDAGAVTEAIRARLLEPYARALAAGAYQEAYQRFTSRAFRQAHSLSDYLAAQAANRAEFGPLVSLTLRDAESFRGARDLLGGRAYHQGGLSYRGTRSETWVRWEVVQEDDQPKLDASFQEFHETLTPRLF